MNKDQQQSGAGFASARTGSQAIDARYGEDVHTITDRLRTTMTNAADSDFLVIGKRSDGSPFLWSTGDQQASQQLAKQVAPDLVGLNA